MYNSDMSRRYDYNRIGAITKGLVTLCALAYFVALVAFVAFLAINYLPALNVIDFTELEFVVSKVFLRLDAFLLIGLGVSLVGFIITATLGKALRLEKGGFRAVILMILGAILITFFVIIKSKGLELSYILNYLFGGVLLVGLLGVLLGLFALIIRIKNRREMEKKVRQYERNYLKFEKYNR